MTARSARSKGYSIQAWDWCVTDNEHGEDPHAMYEILNGIWETKECHYIAAQHEEGKSKHFQIFIQYKKKVTMYRLKKDWGTNTIHCEPRKGKVDEAADYCMKNDGTEIAWCDGKCEQECGGTEQEYFEWGTRHYSPFQAKYNSIIEGVLNGEDLNELMLEFPEQYCSRRNGIKDIAETVKRRKTEQEQKPPTVWIAWGPSGTGKTTWMKEMATWLKDHFGYEAYSIPDDNGWCDDYKEQKLILLDEFKPGEHWIKFSELLKLCDGGFYKFKRRGLPAQASKAEHVIITSNQAPGLWFKDDKYNIGQLARRITAIWHMTEVHESVRQEFPDGWL